MQSRINFPKDTVHRTSSQNPSVVFILFVLICFAGSASLAFSRKAPPLKEEAVPEETVKPKPVPEETVPKETVPEKTTPERAVKEKPVPEKVAAEETVLAGDTSEVNVPSFPYIAEIIGDNVNIRSGAGTDYYRCGKAGKGDRVEVVSHRTVWSRIVPPAGSFSWISMRYVRIDPNNPGTGIVTGDNVRVWAGSDYKEPMHSDSLQLKLNRGAEVKLVGEEKDDYYKIASPTGAYLWVSTKFTKQLGPVGEVPLPLKPRPKPRPVVVVPKISVEEQKLKEYYTLEKQIEAERAKPIAQQNYANIKKALVKISNNKDAGKAARYSKFALNRIGRFELAFEVAKAVRLQNKQLQQIQDGIDKTRAARLAKIQNLGRFAVIGRLQTSSIYGVEAELKHYRVIDNSGKILCYALPSGPASKKDLSKLVGRKVGLVGTIEPHPQTKNALVRFTNIAELK